MTEYRILLKKQVYRVQRKRSVELWKGQRLEWWQTVYRTEFLSNANSKRHELREAEKAGVIIA